MEMRRQKSIKGRTAGVRSTVVGFLTGFTSLTAVNQLIFGESWIKRTWLVMYVPLDLCIWMLMISLGVSDLTPNVGMWWYFVTEMFDHFRPFFLGVFHVRFCL